MRYYPAAPQGVSRILIFEKIAVSHWFLVFSQNQRQKQREKGLRQGCHKAVE
jgi:hypothetical protein